MGDLRLSQWCLATSGRSSLNVTITRECFIGSPECFAKPASVSWANTLRLEFLGINTLKPVALIEERFGPLRGRAYFNSRYLGGDDAGTNGTATA